MTEREWLTATDPERLLTGCSPRPSDRKLRLFAAGCCRRAADANLLGSDAREAISLAEDLADGAATEADRLAVYLGVRTHHGTGGYRDEAVAMAVLRIDAAAAASTGAAAAADLQPGHGAAHADARARERAVQSRLGRCIFGNPFRPVIADPGWRTSAAVALARQAYESRDFGLLPILADALQDAGCENDDVLDHCRGPGPHVRGCWVIDLVLGKK